MSSLSSLRQARISLSVMVRSFRLGRWRDVVCEKGRRVWDSGEGRGRGRGRGLGVRVRLRRERDQRGERWFVKGFVRGGVRDMLAGCG